MPAYEKSLHVFISSAMKLKKLYELIIVSGEIINTPQSVVIYPAVHYLSDDENVDENN